MSFRSLAAPKITPLRREGIARATRKLLESISASSNSRLQKRRTNKDWIPPRAGNLAERKLRSNRGGHELEASQKTLGPAKSEALSAGQAAASVYDPIPDSLNFAYPLPSASSHHRERREFNVFNFLQHFLTNRNPAPLQHQRGIVFPRVFSGCSNKGATRA
ncbi:hypothetical protein PM082_011740 [Marasmius tenuissimus]|nr:hypothetical protein PM082_011740 [Marasmius tenuissimus]